MSSIRCNNKQTIIEKPFSTSLTFYVLFHIHFPRLISLFLTFSVPLYSLLPFHSFFLLSFLHFCFLFLFIYASFFLLSLFPFSKSVSEFPLPHLFLLFSTCSYHMVTPHQRGLIHDTWPLVLFYFYFYLSPYPLLIIQTCPHMNSNSHVEYISMTT